MDIARPDTEQRKRKRRFQILTAGVALVGTLVAVGLLARPGGFKLERERVHVGTVQRGDMQRSIRGYGTLVPIDIRIVSARSDGTVERIVTYPGTVVEPGTLILELSNPELSQQFEEAELTLQAAEADFAVYRVQRQAEILQLRSALVQLESQYEEARLDAQIDRELNADGLVSASELKRSELKVTQLAKQLEIDRQRLAFSEESLGNQLASQQSAVDRARARANLLGAQIEGLQVRAGVAGVLQRQTVEPGMRVQAGQNLAQVADPAKLKAVLRIPEFQAKDVAVGQEAEIDTRNGLVRGKVFRIDPNVEGGTVAIDVQLTEALPVGSRPDLSIEGVVELETLSNVLFVDRPAFVTRDARVSIYRFTSNTEAEKTPVVFGRVSARSVEVLEGLDTGDRIILTDSTE